MTGVTEGYRIIINKGVLEAEDDPLEGYGMIMYKGVGVTVPRSVGEEDA